MLIAAIPATPPSVEVPPGLVCLAAAVAGGPVQLAWLNAGQPSYTDGVTLFIDPALAHTERCCVVVAHSLMLASGALVSLRQQSIRRARMTKSQTQVYFCWLLPWVTQQYADRIPSLFARRLALPPPDARIDSLTAALQLALDSAPAVPLPAWLGELRPRRIQAHAIATTHAPSQAAREDASSDENARPLNDAERKLLARLKSPLRGFGLADLLLSLMDFKRSAGQPSEQQLPNDDASGALAHASGRTALRGALQALAGRLARVVRGPPRDGTWYAEWDVQHHNYRTRHVLVQEILPLLEPASDAAPTQPEQQIVGLAQALAHIGTIHQRLRRQPKGADLDLDACIEFHTRRRSGQSPHANLFIATKRNKRDLSALILLDISRSTADKGPDGRTALHTHANLAGQLVQVFERLGDRVALYGFHSWGRELVRCVRLKRFDERWAHCLPRMAGLEPSGMTRMGAALRHATALLSSEQHHKKRLLLLLTDGFSYDDGYAGEYAQADTRQALREAATHGIATVCIHIGTEQDDRALATLYGEAAYLRRADCSGLAQPLRRLIEGALHGAESARARRYANAAVPGMEKQKTGA